MMARRKLDEFDLEALAEQAHRERAEAVYRLLLQPLANLFKRAPRPHRPHQRTHRRAAA
jgi:hypothetical protein